MRADRGKALYLAGLQGHGGQSEEETKTPAQLLALDWNQTWEPVNQSVQSIKNQSTNQYNQSRTSQPISTINQAPVNQSVQSIKNQSTNQYNQSRTSQPISATDQELVNQSVQSIKNQSTNQCNQSKTSQPISAINQKPVNQYNYSVPTVINQSI